MSEVEFIETTPDAPVTYKSRAVLGQPETPAMVRFLVSRGIVRSEKQAGYLLLGITVFFFLVAAFTVAYFILGVGHAPLPVASEEEVSQRYAPK